MNVNIETNIEEVTKHLTIIQKKQIPFAAAQALNDTAFGLKKAMSNKADKTFEGGARPFTKRGFLVEKADKRNLVAELYIEKRRAEYMDKEIEGGVRRPKKDAITIANANNYKGALTKAGNIRPTTIKRFKNNEKKYFFGKPKGMPSAKEGIWERYGREATGSSAGARIRQVALFTKRGFYKPLFPFYQFGKQVIMSPSAGFSKKFIKRLNVALRHAR